MSNICLFNNNASTLLASAMTNTQTTLTVTATQGAYFPSPGAGTFFPVTVEDTSGNIEIMYCTGRTGDTLTVSRAAEAVDGSATALAFASGSRVEQRITAGMLSLFLQKTGGDTLSGTTNLSGVLALGSGGSIQGGEFTGALRSGAGVTAGQITVSGGIGYCGGAVLLTASNLASNLPSGTDLARTNMIVLWNGTTSNVPTGWHLCDGTNGTPNLEDQFIVGGGGALPTSGTYAPATSNTKVTQPTVAGSIAAANLPRHTHGSTIYGGGAGQVVGPTGQAAGGNYFTGGTGAGVAINWVTDTGTGLAATPTPLSVSLADTVGHTHTIAVPYRAVFFIMKL